MWAQAYANNLVDHHLVLDLVPAMAGAYFARRLPVPLMHTQAAILAGLGLQRCDVSALEVALGLPAGQVLALFNKVRCRACAGCVVLWWGRAQPDIFATGNPAAKGCVWFDLTYTENSL